MNHIQSLSKGFLVALLLSLVAGCGAEFQGATDEGGEAGSSGEPQAGASNAGSAGSSMAGTGGSAGSNTAGTGGGSVAGAAGSGAAGDAGAAGSGGAAAVPTCSPEEATLELVGTTFTLGELEWTDGTHCASCPPGGCATCTVESAHVDIYDPEAEGPGAHLGTVLRCDSAILAGSCDGEPALCTSQMTRSERVGSSTFSVNMDLIPRSNGYELVLAATAASPEGREFSCGGHYYDHVNSKIVELFEEKIANHSLLRCN